ncbi:MAG TPA: von Willebrand factor type A domain-containing protein [Polyangiaceae bacterium]|nr:von Willebrand factor type A domain-containing protein [Polyangiaceae bacterium]
MIPSSSPGRARRAPSFRPFSLLTVSLMLAVACNARTPKAVKTVDATATVAPAPTGEATPANREGGTGTRAKGEDGALGRSDAPMERKMEAQKAKPASPALRAPMGYGAGIGLMGPGAASTAAPLAGQAIAGGHVSRRVAVAPGARLRAIEPEADRKLNTESYSPLGENAFLSVGEHPLSTFSSDVDTASYSNARRFLGDGQLPPKDSIRVEEWLNYFSYAYAPPVGDAPVAIHTEVSECPWQPAHRLVRIGIKARPIEQAAVPPRNLVFLVDVSGSMMPANKLPLLKNGLAMLTRTLRPQDQVAMVVYAGSSGLALPATPGSKQNEILTALGALEAGGSTNGGQGIELAYRIAQEHFVKGGINRVVLATDGDFNVGTTSEGELVRLIEEKRKTGVFLTVLGFGDGNLKDSTMELLADKGNGNYAYIDSASEARKVLVREAGSTLVTVAKDVKLQAEFNPARVQSYRLVGYEDRLLADQDFNDDKKDAGDMGAGHSVTALYEVVPVGAPAPAGQPPAVSPLKYQSGSTLAPASSRSELLTVSVRYKAPQGNTSSKISEVVVDQPEPFASASADHRFAAAVAEFAQILRGSPAVAGQTLAGAKKMAQAALTADATGDRRELLSLIEHARGLGKEPLSRAE